MLDLLVFLPSAFVLLVDLVPLMPRESTPQRRVLAVIAGKILVAGGPGCAGVRGREHPGALPAAVWSGEDTSPGVAAAKLPSSANAFPLAPKSLQELTAAVSR